MVRALDVAAKDVLEGAFDALEVSEEFDEADSLAYALTATQFISNPIRVGRPEPERIGQELDELLAGKLLANVDQGFFHSDPRWSSSSTFDSTPLVSADDELRL